MIKTLDKFNTLLYRLGVKNDHVRRCLVFYASIAGLLAGLIFLGWYGSLSPHKALTVMAIFIALGIKFVAEAKGRVKKIGESLEVLLSKVVIMLAVYFIIASANIIALTLIVGIAMLVMLFVSLVKEAELVMSFPSAFVKDNMK